MFAKMASQLLSDKYATSSFLTFWQPGLKGCLLNFLQLSNCCLTLIALAVDQQPKSNK